MPIPSYHISCFPSFSVKKIKEFSKEVAVHLILKAEVQRKTKSCSQSFFPTEEPFLPLQFLLLSF